HDGKQSWKQLALKPGDDPLNEIKGELFDIRAEVQVGSAEQVVFTVRGLPVIYDRKKGEVSCQGKTAPLKARKDDSVRLQILVDRGSIEVFGNDGQVALSVGVLVPVDNRSLSLTVKGGKAKVSELEVNTLRSAWK